MFNCKIYKVHKVQEENKKDNVILVHRIYFSFSQLIFRYSYFSKINSFNIQICLHMIQKVTAINKIELEISIMKLEGKRFCFLLPIISQRCLGQNLA